MSMNLQTRVKPRFVLGTLERLEENISLRQRSQFFGP